MDNLTEIILGALTVAATAFGIVMQRRGRHEDTSLEQTRFIESGLREDFRDYRSEVRLLRKEVADLWADNMELRRQAAPFRDVPDARPMSEFVDAKLLAALNARALHPLGGHCRIYIDDVHGHFALGHQIVPISEVPTEHLHSPTEQANHELILVEYVRASLERYASPPWPPPQ